jgi:hypothetical protein
MKSCGQICRQVWKTSMPTTSSGQAGYYWSETCFYVLTVMNLINNVVMEPSLGGVFPQMEAVAFIYGAPF